MQAYTGYSLVAGLIVIVMFLGSGDEEADSSAFLWVLACVACVIQSNLDSSNTDGSFTMANSNSFLSPYETLPLAQENKYLGKFYLEIVCCVYSLESPHRAILMQIASSSDSNAYTQHTIIVKEIKIKSLKYRYLLSNLAP